MNKLKIVMSLIIIVFITSSNIAWAGDTTIVWQVLSGGGTNASNDDYVLKGTLRQTAIRHSTDTSYINRAGFWYYAFSLGPCCIGIRGNCNGDVNEQVNILDQQFLVNRIFRGGPLPSCCVEGDVNGDGTCANIVDLNYMNQYIFSGGPPPPACP